MRQISFCRDIIHIVVYNRRRKKERKQKGKVFIKMEEVILTLSRTEFYKKLEDFWTEILNKHITGGTGHFYATIEFSYGRATFIIDKSNLYIVGYVVNNEEIYFRNVSYTNMKTEASLKKDDILSALYTFTNRVNEYSSTMQLVTVITLISEAARFDFVRAIIKRSFCPDDRENLEKCFSNWDYTINTFTERKHLDDLVTNYDKMKQISSSVNIPIDKSRAWCDEHIKAGYGRSELVLAGLLPLQEKKHGVVTSPGYGLDDVSITTNSADNTITFSLPDGRSETYSMTKIPSKDSYLMQALTKNMLNGLQVQKTVDNLNNITGLLAVAAAALTGTSVKSRVTNIQYDYTKVCGNEYLTVRDLTADCRNVAKNIGKVYDELVSANEDEAITWLRKCEKIADEMADKTQEMANSFMKLSDKAEEAVEETEDEVFKQQEKADELRRQNEEYQAELEKNKVLQEQINDDLVDVNQSLQKAVEDEEAARKRKHGFEIAGLVGNMVSGIVDMFTPDLGGFGRNDSSQKNIEEANQEDIKKLNDEIAQAEAEYEADKNTEIQDRAKCDQLNAEISDLEKQKETATGDQLTQIEAALTDKNALLLTANAELEAAVLAVEMAEKKMNELKKTLSELVERCDSIKDSAALEEEKAREEKEQIYSKKMELEEERRDCLSSIAEFSTLIESTAQEQQTAETALRTLTLAASCIKDVVQSLLMMVSFWRSISSFCSRLDDTDLDEEIESNMKVDANKRVAYYYDSDFMLMMLKFLCQWGSLYYVFTDFSNEISSIPEKQNKCYGIEVTPDKAGDLAEKLATMLNASISSQIAEQDAFIEELSKKEI